MLINVAVSNLISWKTFFAYVNKLFDVFRNDDLTDNQCMAKRKEHTLLIGGKNKILVEMDLNTKSMTQK